MNKIIQFPHPGSEHNDKSGKEWNTGYHKRKYLKVNGYYLKDIHTNPINNIIYFWGEWEAQSHVTPITSKRPRNFPNYVFAPFYQLPIHNVNTDPFVFGEQFYYSICKQGHYPKLRDLDKGSLIIFGSNKNKNFVIDTLFVVKCWKDYEISNIQNLKGEYNEVFHDISLKPIIGKPEVSAKKVDEIIENGKQTGICNSSCGDDENDNNPVKKITKYRIYEAVMYEDREKFDDTFSYAPCLPDPNGDNGFARPTINLPYISKNLNQGIKVIMGENVKKVWNEITQEVLKQDLNLLIKTNLPQIMLNLKNKTK